MLITMGLPFLKINFTRYQQPVVRYYDRIDFHSIQVVEEEFG